MPQAFEGGIVEDSENPGVKMKVVQKRSRALGRRFQALRDRNRRNCRANLDLLAKDASIKHHRISLLEERIRNDLQLKKAYRLVSSNRSFDSFPDVDSAYQKGFTIDAMRHEIKDTIRRMQPAYVLAKKATAKISEARQITNDLIERNRKALGFIPDTPPEEEAEEEESVRDNDSFVTRRRRRKSHKEEKTRRVPDGHTELPPINTSRPLYTRPSMKPVRLFAERGHLSLPTLKLSTGSL